MSEHSNDAEVSWENIVAKGDRKTIEMFLTDANIREIAWSRITHRMIDPTICKVVTAALAREKSSRRNYGLTGLPIATNLECERS